MNFETVLSLCQLVLTCCGWFPHEVTLTGQSLYDTRRLRTDSDKNEHRFSSLSVSVSSPVLPILLWVVVFGAKVFICFVGKRLYFPIFLLLGNSFTVIGLLMGRYKLLLHNSRLIFLLIDNLNFIFECLFLITQ